MLLFLVISVAAVMLRMGLQSNNKVLDEDTSWRVEISAKFTVEKDKSYIYFTQPLDTPYIKVISQHIQHPGLKILARGIPNKPRARVMRAYENGRVSLNIQYVMKQSAVNAAILPVNSSVPLDAVKREAALQLSDIGEGELKRLRQKNKKLTSLAKNKPDIASAIFTYTSSLILDERKTYQHLDKIIKTGRATNLGKARMLVALARINQIPARMVTGIQLAEDNDSALRFWVELRLDERWVSFDPVFGYQVQLPKNYLPLKFDSDVLFEMEQAVLHNESVKVTEDLFALEGQRIGKEKKLADVLDLRRLDIDTQLILGYLLLLPLGVLVSAFIRHVVGLFPYGTFTPTLLALAVIYADIQPTLIIVFVVISLSLLTRVILPNTLPRVPRLSLMFTFVAMSMVLSISLMAYYEITPNGHVVLLPIVIFTTLIDRFYSYWDRNGLHPSLIRLAVTCFIAMLCVPIIRQEELGKVLLTYPELHFITAALVILFSCYEGKKLTDFPALKLFGENKEKTTSKKKKAVVEEEG